MKNYHSVGIDCTLTDKSLTLEIPLEILQDGQEHIFSVKSDTSTHVRLLDGISDDTFEQYRLNLLTPAADK